MADLEDLFLENFMHERDLPFVDDFVAFLKTMRMYYTKLPSSMLLDSTQQIFECRLVEDPGYCYD